MMTQRTGPERLDLSGKGLVLLLVLLKLSLELSELLLGHIFKVGLVGHEKRRFACAGTVQREQNTYM